MRGDIEMREPERDPVLAAALREAYADAPLDAERAQALRSRIRAQAETLAPAAHATTLDQRRLVGAAEPVYTARPHFRRPIWAVPALLAATLAAVLLVHRRERGPVPLPAAPPAAAAVGFGSAEQALSADVSDAEFARVVTREDDPAALLAIAVQAPPGPRSR